MFLDRPLRPFPISGQRVVPASIEKPDWFADVSPFNFCISYSLLFFWIFGGCDW